MQASIQMKLSVYNSICKNYLDILRAVPFIVPVTDNAISTGINHAIIPIVLSPKV